MRINLFDIDEFVKVNNVKEVKSAVLFHRGNERHPQGLISQEIFGHSLEERKTIFGYIDLKSPFIHPYVYKILRQKWRVVEKIVNGDYYFSVDKDGNIVEDQMGNSGLQHLYDNWNKINWDYSDDDSEARKEVLKLLKNTPKNRIFWSKAIVIPVYYRDVKNTSKGGESGDLNKLYGNLIRLTSLVSDRDLFGFQFFKTQSSIQENLVELYDYFLQKIDGKNGLIRKYLMGKTTDYGGRVVITSPTFHADKPEDMFTTFGECGLPVSLACSLCMPFVVRWLRVFFQRNIISKENGLTVWDPKTNEERTVTPKDPASYFSEEYCKKAVNKYISDPTCRFNTIEIPLLDSNERMFLSFTGMKTQGTDTSEVSSIANRATTWTDLLFLACNEITKDKYVIVTRYPVSDEFGLFMAKAKVLSTTVTEPMMVDGVLYKYYPKVEIGLPHSRVAEKFIDSMQFSNSYLEGLDGDYDGDQITVKMCWSKEANEDCERLVNSKQYLVNIKGECVRVVSSEAVQTFYTLTKDIGPKDKPYALAESFKKELLEMPIEDITFHKLVEWFGNVTVKGTTEVKKPKIDPKTPITLKAKEYINTSEVNTTIGRLVFNRVVLERGEVQSVTGYVNDNIVKKALGKIEAKLSRALIEDKITVQQFWKYIDARDWLGFQMHGVLCTSYTPGTIKVLPQVTKLKKKLIEENKEALARGDEVVSEKIENELLATAKEILKDDVGMDLYNSGARGSFGNNYKNVNVMRGAIKNPETGGFDIITNSLLDSLDRKDMAPHSNSILGGAYAKGVATAESGYLGKQLMQLMQSETLAEAGSDCGTKKTIKVTLTPGNSSRYVNRYIIDGSKLVCLDDDTMPKYIGKTVNMRSPMYCTYDNGHHVCEKCMGKEFYRLGKTNIGLTCFKLGTTCTNLGMKKFHDATVHTTKVDPDTLLIDQ